MPIINGYDLSILSNKKLKTKIEKYSKNNRKPKLSVICVGDDKASKKYIERKQKACDYVGILSDTIFLCEDIKEIDLINEINKLNLDDTVDGILVQLPLPKHISLYLVLNSINVNKDVDAFHNHYLGSLYYSNKGILPCTPKAILHMLKSINIDLSGKDVLIIGRSTIVSKPLMHMLLHEDATVTIAHSKTKNLKEKSRNSDIVISAIGKSKFLTTDYFTKDSIVIDVGINIDENGILTGDVDFNNVEKLVKYISPVPKGVGPLTVSMLLENTFKLYLENLNKNSQY